MAGRFGRSDDRDGRGPKGWQVDQKGRKYRDEGTGRVYENQGDRDEALEERYRLYCNVAGYAPCCSSLLQHVATHEGMLVAEYMAFVRDARGDARDDEELRRWEVQRFGDRAYPAAHALLRYQVRVAVLGDPYKRARRPEPRVTPGLTDAQRLDRMQVALHKVTEAKEMPEGQSHEERDRQLNKLRGQVMGGLPRGTEVIDVPKRG